MESDSQISNIMGEVMSASDLYKTYKVVELKNGGLIIRLVGYPISFIKITYNPTTKNYNLIIRDCDGWIYRVVRNVDGELLGITIDNAIKDATCT